MFMCTFGESETVAPSLGSGQEAHTASKSVGRCGRTSFSTANQKTSALKLLRHDKPVFAAAWPAILTVVVPRGQRVSGAVKRQN